MPRSSCRFALAVATAACFSLGVLNWDGARRTPAAQSPPGRKANIVRDIVYTKPADPKTARRQTLDLHLPETAARKPPLVVFIHGGFWTLSDDEYRIGAGFADALVTKGVAVALVRYRLAPAHAHPAQAEDVAAALAYLVRSADKYGYDGKRIFLAGHSAGAHLAALVALDRTYLAAHRLNPGALAGVLGFSGIYDLRPKAESAEQQKRAVQQAFGDHPDSLAAASPITHAQGAAPPFLILGAENDFSGFLVDAKRFADSLRAAGNKNIDRYVISDRDHFSMLNLTGTENEVRGLVLDFLNVQPLPLALARFIEAKRRWLNPSFSTLPFWRDAKLIRSYPVDKKFVDALVTLYGSRKYELLEWPLETYYAMDLFSYLDSLPAEKIGHGDYLIVTNFRNEKLFWERRRVEPYHPLIVIGLDDERNLFRTGVFYQMLREYSWKDGPRPPMMASPLGAFIHFTEEPPAEFVRRAGFFALTEASFQLVEQDPLAALKDLPKELYEVVTFRKGCVYCHSFRGVGAQSHHITASDGRPHGGIALPLESYPDDVWKAFLFDNHEVAAKIGASPKIVDEELRQALYDLVVKSRASRPAINK